ncbi:sensor histidine kinase [Streptomyces zhihengii]
MPLPVALLLAAVVGLGELMTLLARRLLGPSADERLAALEERTEQLLERNRIARELHDSIGHALTVAVVQAGAARAAGSPEFTERALAAIEETGRAALEDLERVLLVLRESGQRPAGGRPTLADADRLLESARASGAALDAELSGPLAQVPGPVSREGYRIVQEALTNVLRHAGPVPTRVRIAVAAGRLELDVRNPITEGAAAVRGNGVGGNSNGKGSGLRGIRERAALLGGEAAAGPHGDEWRVTVGLPLDGPR